jgi:hypothetical protein
MTPKHERWFWVTVRITRSKKEKNMQITSWGAEGFSLEGSFSSSLST